MQDLQFMSVFLLQYFIGCDLLFFQDQSQQGYLLGLFLHILKTIEDLKAKKKKEKRKRSKKKKEIKRIYILYII
jgi:uncharacterized protein (UPF0305 family)